MPQPDIFVVCMKWGDRYPAQYVNTLARAAREKLARPHRFVCVTDDATGLEAGVEHRDFPPFPLPKEAWSRGIWPKLSLFHADLFPPGSMVLYLDLDIVLLDALDPFVDTVLREGDLWLIREWNPTLLRLLPLELRPDRGGNSSVVGWIAGTQGGILEAFERDPETACKRWYNDQIFMSHFAARRRYWPDRWVASFKRHCVWYFPFSLLRPQANRPDWAKIVIFHGRPDPIELIQDGHYQWGRGRRRGWGPVPWVQDYFRRFQTGDESTS